MKLTAKYSDLNTQTPAQMDFWHVLYSPIPEAAIDASSGYTWLPGSTHFKKVKQQVLRLM